MPESWWSRRMWGAHLVGAVLVVAAIFLGNWQLGAWSAHREADKIDRTREAPVALDDVFGSDDPFPAAGVGKPVTIDGIWLPESTVEVSGREHEGVEGYWIVTPIAVGDISAPAIPVVRGWLPNLDTIPEPPTGPVNITAWLQPGEGSLIDDDDPTDTLLPQMRVADLIQHVDQDLYGGYAISQEVEEGLEPADLAQMPSTGAGEGLRNFLYAVEWWCFGLLAIIVWWRFVMELRYPERYKDPEELDEVDGADGSDGSGGSDGDRENVEVPSPR